MPARITKETLYIRYNFKQEELAAMGLELAGCHNQLQTLQEEENAVKAQLKERKTAIEQKQGTLARNMSGGFEMRNESCTIKYDDPNVGELTYYRPDGTVEKTRPMTETERQMDLPLSEETVVVPPETSAANITEFFGEKTDEREQPVGAVVEGEATGDAPADPEPGDGEPGEGGEDDEEDEEDARDKEYDPVANSVVEMPQQANGKSGPAQLAAFHEAEVEKQAKKDRKKKGAPTDQF